MCVRRWTRINRKHRFAQKILEIREAPTTGVRVQDVGLGSENSENPITTRRRTKRMRNTTPGENRARTVKYQYGGRLPQADGRQTVENRFRTRFDGESSAEMSGEPAMGDRRLRDAMMVFGCPFSFFFPTFTVVGLHAPYVLGHKNIIIITCLETSYFPHDSTP